MAATFLLKKDKQDFKRISLDKIAKNPGQPRKLFDTKALFDLAESIRRFGVITPLTVRRKEGGFELVAGERRLRAAKMAGLSSVPCYIIEVCEEDSSLMALVENIARRDLDFFEEAQSIRRLCKEFGMTQEQVAQRIGRTQSAVANKLRLLRLPQEIIELVRLHNLTERHARALLRIDDEAMRRKVTDYIIDKGMNVEQAERYVELMLEGRPSNKGKRQIILKDVRIFVNTVEHALGIMRKSGLSPEMEKRQEGDKLMLVITLPTM